MFEFNKHKFTSQELFEVLIQSVECRCNSNVTQVYIYNNAQEIHYTLANGTTDPWGFCFSNSKEFAVAKKYLQKLATVTGINVTVIK